MPDSSISTPAGAPYTDVMSWLQAQNVLPALFDLSRVVDAESGKVLELKNGTLLETRVTCNKVLGNETRCQNCTSIRAHYSKETVVKLEYANNMVLLILSVPTCINGQHVVVELIKDITKSMTVDIKNPAFSSEASSIIAKLNKVSTTDPLTGLQNRRYLDERLPLALAKCRQMNKPVSLVMIDIDHFKSVNDEYGHQHGDIILVGVADMLRSCIRRNSDFAVRYGGEEMLLCFPGVTLKDSLSICERVRRQVEAASFEYNGHCAKITVSIGLSEGITDGVDTKDALIGLADRRLYEAKRGGRNRIVSQG